jgi:hypothetical protein
VKPKGIEPEMTNLIWDTCGILVSAGSLSWTYALRKLRGIASCSHKAEEIRNCFRKLLFMDIGR